MTSGPLPPQSSTSSFTDLLVSSRARPSTEMNSTRWGEASFQRAHSASVRRHAVSLAGVISPRGRLGRGTRLVTTAGSTVPVDCRLLPHPMIPKTNSAAAIRKVEELIGQRRSGSISDPRRADGDPGRCYSLSSDLRAELKTSFGKRMVILTRLLTGAISALSTACPPA